MVGPLLRGRSPTRSVAPKQPRGSGVLLSGISGSRVGAERIWRGVISVYWFRGELRFIGFGGAMRLEAIGPPGRGRGGVVSIYWFRRPRVNPSCHPYARARARPWSARCYGVARQRDRSRQNSRGARAVLLSGISGSRVGAKQSRRSMYSAWRGSAKLLLPRLGLRQWRASDYKQDSRDYSDAHSLYAGQTPKDDAFSTSLVIPRVPSVQEVAAARKKRQRLCRDPRHNEARPSVSSTVQGAESGGVSLRPALVALFPGRIEVLIRRHGGRAPSHSARDYVRAFDLTCIAL